MSWSSSRAAATLLICGCAGAFADDGAVEPPPPAAPQPHWEGAIGLNGSYGATYQGGSERVTKFSPGFFLRYGRFTVTNASGYVTRRADDVFRGLGVDLKSSDRFRANVALRFDAGRSDTTAAALNGLGDIEPTVRARVSGTWKFDGGWRATASWSIDAFGRGGGNFADAGFAREQRIDPDTVFTWGSTLTVGGSRYMQTYFGITDAQSAATGYPAYRAAGGLRDVAAFVGVRHDLSARWLLLANASASKLLGPAANSPLSTRPNAWGLSGGLAWRF